MAFNVFAGGRKKESVAYDLAVNLAAKDPAITTPESFIQRVADLLPACREAVSKKYKDESPTPFGIAIKR
ncbi:hypothetical protein DO628_09765 [Salmonella enterica subsp. salamae]|uniref:Uncharacterized protein n=2 Tax=Salmonella enterica TaxID=28901 RepID=A0A702CIT5_SALER|nr:MULTISPECIES: hypothetical protein [Salmonella]EAA4082223.1 hypothetical protein [Salmonella enterica subsp. salamae serovar Sofia]EBH8940897.1 hypothetical protein [Salmonella enterica subsp. enterica serovar Braenderup]EBZ9074741.1 hypothetical protein [Salmonella enterica subsp. enterica serovar Saintpaul]EDQ9773306.1 hypothetical protein [Salmonella enterica subsp. salamae]EDT7498553.1 hypothetical protein [Salmonella enterica subsp. enterica serovar Schleissheim]EHB3479675.1 hypotheti